MNVAAYGQPGRNGAVIGELKAGTQGVSLAEPKSRFCEARIVFEDSTSDTAYFRSDGRKDPEATDFNFDPCSLRDDVSKNGCADQRVPVEPATAFPGQPQ